ncbi:hypothetical protein pdam_00013024 [Pocillopora damicornis]|uniref:Mannosyltransferase n=1 Tax=Pocillopora damicornis TaxID=46731 RepID=A0A3M6V0E6_POCDA|nr:hypothetical protein pdam_00013024 [Pocillopora damicornis]
MAARRQKAGTVSSSLEATSDSTSHVDVDLTKKLSQPDKSVWCPRPYTIFKLLLSARFCSAFLSNISDCDETFNYWEPMHFLMFGSGFQTWEYSPKYAIRSYAYLLLHTVPGKLQIQVFEANKVAVLATAAGSLIGWPFSAVLGVPIAWDIIVRQRKIMYFIQLCLISLIVFLGPLVYIDSFFYGKTVIAPLGIVLYNVFGKGGPSLYGVEPWSFYFLNGFLNFNIVFPMALLALPACVIPSSVLPIWLSLMGMYIWILIFFTRPHKEERFLFPIYPFFCLFGAVTLTNSQKLFHGLFFSGSRHHYSASSTWFAVSASVVFSVLSLSRSSALYYGYHAPMDLFIELNHMSSKLEEPLPQGKQINLCVGKEWYRFPSSFFLPSERWHLQFIRSEFRGQLPKPYADGRNATKIIPTYMNDMNEEEPSRYMSISKCDFLVDLETERETELEPNFVKRTKDWEVVLQKPFLDAERSHRLFRAFYIPFVSYRFTKYSNYVLLRSLRKTSAKAKKGRDRKPVVKEEDATV